MNQKEKKKRFDRVAQNIKDIKIQGAKNIAKSALKVYFLIPTKASEKKLLSKPKSNLTMKLCNTLRILRKK
jgi:hypothetical protein